MTKRRRRALGEGMKSVLRLLVLALALDAAVVAWVLRNPSARLLFRYRKAPETWTVPVAGVRPADLQSTWLAPRPGGRKHHGIDIFAPKGTAVVAATDGVVMRVGTNPLGGNVVWLLGEGLQVHYYAHLDEWAPGLEAGQHVRAGEVLGTVGNTGNARTTPAHLHFGLSRASIRKMARVSYDPALVLQGARTVEP